MSQRRSRLCSRVKGSAHLAADPKDVRVSISIVYVNWLNTSHITYIHTYPFINKVVTKAQLRHQMTYAK